MIASLVLGTQSCLITARAETATTAPEIKVESPSMLKSLLGKTEPPAKTGPVELKRYLPEQPNLKGFANGDSLDPYSELNWDKIYDQATGQEASYTIVIINPERREATAWKHVVGNSCKVKDIKNIDDLIDGFDVAVLELEFLPLAVAAHEVGRFIDQLVDDRAQRGSVWWFVDVVHDLDIYVQLVRNAHGIGRGVSMSVVIDGCDCHGWRLRADRVRAPIGFAATAPHPSRRV